MGILAPRHDDWQIRNLDLRNTTDMLIVESRLAPRTMQMENITFGSLAGTAVRETQLANVATSRWKRIWKQTAANLTFS